MAAWSANQAKLAWVTNRSGPQMKYGFAASDGSERPVVTAADFPDGRNKWFMNPFAVSGWRKADLQRIDSDGVTRSG
jgi:hypothetical protein